MCAAFVSCGQQMFIDNLERSGCELHALPGRLPKSSARGVPDPRIRGGAPQAAL
jgi:hypothetical protein